MGSISLPTLIAYGIAVILLLFVISAFKTPVRIIGKIILNSLLGLIAIIIVNSIGNYLGFHIPVNLYTVFTAGILGIPGFVLVIILTRLF
jgi:pro-sigmaK processing inhibitor BofA